MFDMSCCSRNLREAEQPFSAAGLRTVRVPSAETVSAQHHCSAEGNFGRTGRRARRSRLPRPGSNQPPSQLELWSYVMLSVG